MSTATAFDRLAELEAVARICVVALAGDVAREPAVVAAAVGIVAVPAVVALLVAAPRPVSTHDRRPAVGGRGLWLVLFRRLELLFSHAQLFRRNGLDGLPADATQQN